MRDPVTRVAGVQAAAGSGAYARTQSRGRAIHAQRPEVAAALQGVRDALRTSGTLPPRLIELLRIRVAFHNQCRSCMALRYEPDLVDETLVCSLELPAEAPDLTAAERAALDFADRFATNHLSIDAAVYEGLREHFGEGELVELGVRVAFFVGMGRLAATWNMVEDLPEEFRDDGPVAPWGHADVVSA